MNNLPKPIKEEELYLVRYKYGNISLSSKEMARNMCEALFKVRHKLDAIFRDLDYLRVKKLPHDKKNNETPHST